jgi:hypothetical protein
MTACKCQRAGEYIYTVEESIAGACSISSVQAMGIRDVEVWRYCGALCFQGESGDLFIAVFVVRKSSCLLLLIVMLFVQ